MMKFKKKFPGFFALFMAVFLGFATVATTPVFAKSLEEIRNERLENKKQQESTQQQKDNAQDEVDELQEEANELGKTYNSYNSKLQAVNDEISETENAIASTSASISQLETELEEAKANEEAQYEGMKTRIQYMYEDGSQSLLVTLLESGSILEFLRRAEYVAAITKYDRSMVEAYANLQETIEEKSEQLSEKKSQLSAYNETLSSKQDELGELVTDAKSAYTKKAGEVSVAEMSVEQYDALIAQYRAQEAELESQEAAAQAELAKQLAASEQTTTDENGTTTVVPEDNSGALNGYSDADLKLMAAIIEAEAGNQSYEGQLAVGTVIMNRVMSSKFPNTLSGVIYQTNQFQPVRNGHLAAILERGPNASCTNAARQVLNGYRSGDWLFFMTQYWADYYGITGYTMIGAHAFFYRWGAN